jgi:hypothetical protein
MGGPILCAVDHSEDGGLADLGQLVDLVGGELVEGGVPDGVDVAGRGGGLSRTSRPGERCVLTPSV